MAEIARRWFEQGVPAPTRERVQSHLRYVFIQVENLFFFIIILSSVVEVWIPHIYAIQ